MLVLHGGYKRSAGAFVAARRRFQERHKAFVLTPMALLGQPWAEPAAGKGVGPTESLRLAMDALRDVVREFAIDEGRVYVTGSSNGAVGAFAAFVHYRDVLAAGGARERRLALGRRRCAEFRPAHDLRWHGGSARAGGPDARAGACHSGSGRPAEVRRDAGRRPRQLGRLPARGLMALAVRPKARPRGPAPFAEELEKVGCKHGNRFQTAFLSFKSVGPSPNLPVHHLLTKDRFGAERSKLRQLRAPATNKALSSQWLGRAFLIV